MSRLRPIVAAVGAGARITDHPAHARHPFITISRQAGAGGHTLMDRLIARLREIDAVDPAVPDDPPWTGYDRELVEQVAREYRAPRPRVDRLGDEPYSWLDDLIRGLSPTAFTDSEIAVARHTAQTIHDVAERGRSIIVGRGGVFVTRDLPGGIHLHLVAPLKDRVAHLARLQGVSEREAARQVEQIDANRRSFYHRYFPNHALSPELFHLTLNTSALDEETMLDVIVKVVQREAAVVR